MDLREFLVAAELDSYYNPLNNGLKIASVAHIKYVDDEDLAGIGMTKPEIRRLRQFYKKAYPQGAFGIFKKVCTLMYCYNRQMWIVDCGDPSLLFTHT